MRCPPAETAPLTLLLNIIRVEILALAILLVLVAGGALIYAAFSLRRRAADARLRAEHAALHQTQTDARAARLADMNSWQRPPERATG